MVKKPQKRKKLSVVIINTFEIVKVFFSKMLILNFVSGQNRKGCSGKVWIPFRSVNTKTGYSSFEVKHVVYQKIHCVFSSGETLVTLYENRSIKKKKTAKVLFEKKKILQIFFVSNQKSFSGRQSVARNFLYWRINSCIWSRFDNLPKKSK